MNILWYDAGVNCEILKTGVVREGDKVEIIEEPIVVDDAAKPLAFYVPPKERSEDQRNDLSSWLVTQRTELMKTDQEGVMRMETAYDEIGVGNPFGIAKGKPDAAASTTEFPPEISDQTRILSMNEVAAHDSEESAWIVVRGMVYDCTAFLKKHPGGSAAITLNAGSDCTEDFEAVHGLAAWKSLKEYFIGVVGEGAQKEAVVTDAGSDQITLKAKRKVLVQ